MIAWPHQSIYDKIINAFTLQRPLVSMKSDPALIQKIKLHNPHYNMAFLGEGRLEFCFENAFSGFGCRWLMEQIYIREDLPHTEWECKKLECFVFFPPARAVRYPLASEGLLVLGQMDWEEKIGSSSSSDLPWLLCRMLSWVLTLGSESHHWELPQ